MRSATLLALALMVALAACADTALAPDDEAMFVPGELVVTLQDGATTDDFRAYVEASPALGWKQTLGTSVLIGVPEGAELEWAERILREAPALVRVAEPNYYVRTH